jgi:hypothetical protein
MPIPVWGPRFRNDPFVDRPSPRFCVSAIPGYGKGLVYPLHRL